MSGQRLMYLGTRDGVLELREEDSRWEHQRTLLQGKHVQALVAPEGTSLMYAKLHDGVYASSDRGASWDHVFPGSVYYLHVDPSNPETIYAGMEPVALFRSQDCGDSWSELTALRRQPDATRDKWWFPQYPYEGHVKSMHIEPHDSRRIYVAIEHGGFLRTDDGGENWEDITDGIEYIDCHIVHSHPRRENIVFGGTARALYRSEDFGRDWVQVESGITRDDVVAFTVLGGEHPALFLTATKGSPPSWLRPTGAESAVFRSQDDGATWHQLGGGLPEMIIRPTNGLRSDPIDEGRIYLSASEFTGGYAVAGGAVKGGEVWMSPDRGDSWSCVHQEPVPIQLLAVTRN
jgi:photosystem II stability/assembly factor-like uncharacterized protein